MLLNVNNYIVRDEGCILICISIFKQKGACEFRNVQRQKTDILPASDETKPWEKRNRSRVRKSVRE